MTDALFMTGVGLSILLLWAVFAYLIYYMSTTSTEGGKKLLLIMLSAIVGIGAVISSFGFIKYKTRQIYSK